MRDQGEYQKEQPHQSALIFAARMTLPQRSFSSRMKAAASAGELATTSAWISAKRFWISGWRSASTNSALILATSSGGVRGGAMIANQAADTMSGSTSESV